MRIRPLRAEDVDAAREAARSALPPPPRLDEERALAYWRLRFERLIARDPAGCWAAEDDDGRIMGCALSILRDGIWGLSFLAVRPEAQGQGHGRALLDAALSYAGGSRAALIASSTDPKAMRRYSRAGFDLRPCVAAAGIVDRAALPSGLRSREADTSALALAEPLGRHVRGGPYDPEDLAGLYVASGWSVVRCGDDGLALHFDGTPSLLLARDDETAADLLWACLAASGAGVTVDVDFVMAGQDWAVRTLLDAGLPLSPDGPFFTRGDLGPLRPWLPSGTFL